MKKCAVLMDGGFVVKRLYDKRTKSHATAALVLAEWKRIVAHPLLANAELLRLYYYDAAPLSGTGTNPISKITDNFGQHPINQRMSVLHDQLELSQDVALRMGELVSHGWKIKPRAVKEIGKTGRALAADDLQPDIQQKGVDLRIGLDIARLSLREMVDVIVVVSGDSDLVPAFKFARREGIRVYLDYLQASVKRELKAHTDAIL